MDIVSFKHKGLRRFFERNDTRGISQSHVKKLRQIFMAIDSAETLDELETLPGWRLHELHGARIGTWSMVVSGNYRLTFTIEDEQICDIDLEDYH